MLMASQRSVCLQVDRWAQCWACRYLDFCARSGVGSLCSTSLVRIIYSLSWCMPSVPWHCWLGADPGCKKTWVMGCWHGYLSEQDADLYMAQLMPLPLTVSCFSIIQIGFTFLVPAHPGSPGKRAVKRVCVSVLYASLHYWLGVRKHIRL